MFSNQKIKNMKPSFFQRLKFAWYAFMMKDIHNIYPYIYCHSISRRYNEICDNSKRISKCTNKAEVFLSQPEFKIEYSEGNYYHVCKDCADKYIGTFGEDFNSEHLFYKK